MLFCKKEMGKVVELAWPKPSVSVYQRINKNETEDDQLTK